MNQRSPTSLDNDPRAAMVLEQAGHAVYQRQRAAAADSARHQRPWLWIGTGVCAALLALLLLWPQGSLVDRLRWLMQGVCDQVNTIPSWPIALPLDARCTGLYTALVVTLAYLFFLRRIGAMKLPPRGLFFVLVSLVALMAADGLNSLAYVLGYKLYPPHDALRLVTGLGAGMAFGMIGVPLFNGGVRADRCDDHRVIRCWGDLLGSVALLAVVGGLAWKGAAWLFYPLAFLSAGGMIGGLFVINLAVLLLLMGLYRRILVWGQLARPATLSVALTATELIGLAWLRTMLV